jgi:hypothetical protein
LKCTADSCSPANGGDGCKNLETVCPSSTSKCTVINDCTEETGFCTSSQRVCDDQFVCTVDTCDDAATSVDGCVFTAIQSLCEDPNPCVATSVCDPANAQDVSGCVTTPLVCPKEAAGLFCFQESCVEFQGCVDAPRDCSGNFSINGTCDHYNCSETLRECEFIVAECFNYFGAVVGILVAGAIGGIVAAACIIALCMVSGGVFAVSQTYGVEQEAKISNNPIYRQQGLGRDVQLGC